MSQLLVKLGLCLSNLVLDFLVFFLAFLLVPQVHLENGLARLEVSDGFVLAIVAGHYLLLSDDLLYLLEFCRDEWSEPVHFEGRDGVVAPDSLHCKLIKLKHADEVVLDLLLLQLSVLLIPRQLLPCLFLLLIDSLLEGSSVFGVDDQLLVSELGQLIILFVVGVNDLLEHRLQFLNLLQLPQLDLLCLRQLHVFLSFQLVILQTVEVVVADVLLGHPEIQFI